MRQPLVVAVAQPGVVSGEVAANAVEHAELVRAAAARVVVFPEMSLTGYELDGQAVTVDDPRLQPILVACAQTQSWALVGAPVPGVSGHTHIGMLAIDGGGVRVAYRKMWLSTEEARHFTPGNTPAVLDVDGWRLGLAICRDTGIEEHAAVTAALGIDVYVAGVLEHEEDVAVPEQRARRIAAEHHVWVAIASFAGSTGGGYARAPGGSGIWSPDGQAVARAGAETGAIARATLA